MKNKIPADILETLEKLDLSKILEEQARINKILKTTNIPKEFLESINRTELSKLQKELETESKIAKALGTTNIPKEVLEVFKKTDLSRIQEIVKTEAKLYKAFGTTNIPKEILGNLEKLDISNFQEISQNPIFKSLWGCDITELSEKDVYSFKDHLDEFEKELNIDSNYELKTTVENIKEHFELDNSFNLWIKKSLIFLLISTAAFANTENIAIQAKFILNFLMTLPKNEIINTIIWYANLVCLIHSIYKDK